MKYLVAGGTGLIGSELVNILSANSENQIFQIKRSDYQNLDPKALQLPQDIEAAFCCLGTTIKVAKSKEDFFKVDHDYVVEFFKLAQSLGIKKWLVVSALGADPRSNVFYNSTKGKMEESLRSLKPSSLVILRPSLLLGSRKEFRLGELIAQKISPLITPLLVGTLKKYAPVQAIAVAQKLFQLSKAQSSGVFVFESDQI